MLYAIICTAISRRYCVFLSESKETSVHRSMGKNMLRRCLPRICSPAPSSSSVPDRIVCCACDEAEIAQTDDGGLKQVLCSTKIICCSSFTLNTIMKSIEDEGMADMEDHCSSRHGAEEKHLHTAEPFLPSSQNHPVDMAEKNVKDILVSTCMQICSVIVKHKGIIWAFLSALAASLTSLLLKLLSGRVSVNQIVSFRSGFFILMALPVLVWHNISLDMPMKIWVILSVRGLIGTASTTCFFYSYQFLDISTAKAITYSSPLFTAFFACLCLKERCNLPTVFFSMTTIVAVLLVVQPSFIFGRDDVGDGVSPIGVIVALSAANCISVSLIILRLLGKHKIHAQVVIFVFGCVGVVVSPIMTSALNEWSIPHCGTDRLLVLCVCILSYSEWMMVTVAVQTEKAAYVGVIRASDVFMTFAFDTLFFRLTPNVLTIIGALGVVASSLGMTLYAHFSNEKEESNSVSSRNV